MQSARDTEHDLFFPLSNANQPLPKQLESFVDQLRNECHQLEQVCAVSVLFPLRAHSKAGGNRSLQHLSVAVMTGNQTMPGPLETPTVLTPYMILTAAEGFHFMSCCFKRHQGQSDCQGEKTFSRTASAMRQLQRHWGEVVMVLNGSENIFSSKGEMEGRVGRGNHSSSQGEPSWTQGCKLELTAPEMARS